MHALHLYWLAELISHCVGDCRFPAPGRPADEQDNAVGLGHVLLGGEAPLGSHKLARLGGHEEVVEGVHGGLVVDQVPQAKGGNDPPLKVHHLQQAPVQRQ